MKTFVRDTGQTVHRIRVGLVGLASVLFVIGLAAVSFSIVNRERPVQAIGAANTDVVANLTMSNAVAPSDGATGEPLAELGVAPSGGSATPAPTPTSTPRR